MCDGNGNLDDLEALEKVNSFVENTIGENPINTYFGYAVHADALMEKIKIDSKNGIPAGETIMCDGAGFALSEAFDNLTSPLPKFLAIFSGILAGLPTEGAAAVPVGLFVYGTSTLALTVISDAISSGAEALCRVSINGERYRFTQYSNGYETIYGTDKIRVNSPSDNLSDLFTYTKSLNDTIDDLYNFKPAIEIKTPTESYSVKSINEITDLEEKYGLTEGQVTGFAANSWMDDQTSDDGSFTLFGSADKIVIPPSAVKPVDYSKLVSNMKATAQGQEVKTYDLAISSNMYIPTSSTGGSATLLKRLKLCA